MTDIFNCYYKRYDSWYERNKFTYLSELEAVRKILPKRGKGLEIGVGTGRFAAPLGIRYGIDPSKNMLKIARQRGVKVRVGSGEKIPFGNNTFDYAAIIITICFVKDPRKVLEESGRVLKRNGKIIIGIIDKDSFLGKFYREKRSIFYKKARFFSIEELKNLLRITGLKPDVFYQTVFRLPAKMNSIENPRKGFGKGGFVVVRATKCGREKHR